MRLSFCRGATLSNKQAFNFICEQPETVAKALVPRLRRVRGTGAAINYLTPPRVLLALALAWFRRGRWFDAEVRLGLLSVSPKGWGFPFLQKAGTFLFFKRLGLPFFPEGWDFPFLHMAGTFLVLRLGLFVSQMFSEDGVLILVSTSLCSWEKVLSRHRFPRASFVLRWSVFRFDSTSYCFTALTWLGKTSLSRPLCTTSAALLSFPIPTSKCRTAMLVKFAPRSSSYAQYSDHSVANPTDGRPL